MSGNNDIKKIYENIQKIREKHGIKFSFSPFAQASGVIGLILAYSAIWSLTEAISTPPPLTNILIGVGIVLLQSMIIKLLGKIHLSQTIQLLLSYFLITLIIVYIGSINVNSQIYNNIQLIGYAGSFIAIYIPILFFTVILSLIFALIIMIPTLFLKIFIIVNYQILSIPLAIILIQLFNKNTWEYSSIISIEQLIVYIIIIAVIPTITSLLLRKDIIFDWLESQSLSALTKSRKDIAEKTAPLFPDEIVNTLIIKTSEISSNFINEKERLNKLNRRYIITLFVQPFVLYILIIIIILFTLYIFPDNIIQEWTASNITIMESKIREAIILGSLAYISLNLSMFSTKENLIKIYNDLVLNRYNEDAYLEILDELFKKMIDK